MGFTVCLCAFSAPLYRGNLFPISGPSAPCLLEQATGPEIEYKFILIQKDESGKRRGRSFKGARGKKKRGAVALSEQAQGVVRLRGTKSFRLGGTPQVRGVYGARGSVGSAIDRDGRWAARKPRRFRCPDPAAVGGLPAAEY